MIMTRHRGLQDRPSSPPSSVTEAGVTYGGDRACGAIPSTVMVLAPRALALFAELRASSAHPAVVAWLERTATEGTDFDGFQVNAFRVAEEVGVSRLDATRAF